MAEFSMAQAAQLQYRLALEFRVSLVQLNNMTAVQLYNLFDALKNEPEKEFIRGVRNSFPVIMKENTLASSIIASGLYNQSREIYGMTRGASQAVNSPYYSTSSDFLKTPAPQKIIDKRMDQLGYEFHRIADQGVPRLQTRGPIVQIAQRAPLDLVHQQIKVDMGLDDAAKNEQPKRVANSQGCNFCKHMAVFVGMEDNPDFHKGCSCTSQPAWAYEVDYRPDWADAHEEAYYRRREEIEANNARNWTRKQRRVQVTRISQKTGQPKTEWKTEEYWVDENGQEGKPESTSIKHIISTMPREK